MLPVPPGELGKKDSELAADDPVRIFIPIFMFLVHIQDMISYHRVPVRVEQKEPDFSLCVDIPDKKQGDLGFIPHRIIKDIQERAPPYQDIQDHAIVLKRFDPMDDIGGQQAEVPGFQVHLLFQKALGAFPGKHIDHFKKKQTCS